MQGDNYLFGMIGLGTMGRSLLLNMADHGFKVAGYDKDADKVALLGKESIKGEVKGFTSLSEFVISLKRPRAVMLLVPAGKIVDAAIAEIAPLLNEGDLIIDGGNSHFTDTNRRIVELKDKKLHFFGMGISGGEEGARKGPSMMPGGDPEAYQVVQPIFEAVSAKVNGDACVAYIGPGASGHFVKMVHNGIEYGLMQLLAETYEIMQKGLSCKDEEMHQLFTEWNAGRMKSFLVEITSDIFQYQEPGANHLLLHDIKDEARSKGTGKWTSQIAMDLQAPIVSIDSAVSMRDLSKYKSVREKASALYPAGDQKIVSDRATFIRSLEEALYFSTIITYAQGMHMLSLASQEFGYGLKMEEIAQIWRGGCIIRSVFLQDIYQAYKRDKGLKHLALDSTIASHLTGAISGMRRVVSEAMAGGIAIPAYAASLSYFDALRSSRMPSNLIQAQRDYFGAHTYERIGKEGVFHTNWIHYSSK